MKKGTLLWLVLGGGALYVWLKGGPSAMQAPASPSTSALATQQAANLGVSTDTLAAMPYLAPSSTSS